MPTEKRQIVRPPAYSMPNLARIALYACSIFHARYARSMNRARLRYAPPPVPPCTKYARPTVGPLLSISKFPFRPIFKILALRRLRFAGDTPWSRPIPKMAVDSAAWVCDAWYMETADLNVENQKVRREGKRAWDVNESLEHILSRQDFAPLEREPAAVEEEKEAVLV